MRHDDDDDDDDNRRHMCRLRIIASLLLPIPRPPCTYLGRLMPPFCVKSTAYRSNQLPIDTLRGILIVPTYHSLIDTDNKSRVLLLRNAPTTKLMCQYCTSQRLTSIIDRYNTSIKVHASARVECHRRLCDTHLLRRASNSDKSYFQIQIRLMNRYYNQNIPYMNYVVKVMN
jgi:hypothetical protein